jgi:hypothetical protein
MQTQFPARKSRCQQVIDHLQLTGRITDATARQQFGAFRLADAIYRLRRERKHLVPKGKAIITVPRIDVNGTPFAEYRLVQETPRNA